MSVSLDFLDTDEQVNLRRDQALQKREVADHQVLLDQESLLQRVRIPCLPSDRLHQER